MLSDGGKTNPEELGSKLAVAAAFVHILIKVYRVLILDTRVSKTINCFYMGWNPYKGLELCKPVMGDKKGRGRVLLRWRLGWEVVWGHRGGPRKAKVMSFLTHQRKIIQKSCRMKNFYYFLCWLQ